MEKLVEKALRDNQRILNDFIKSNMDQVISFAQKIVWAFNNDKKLIICGNGGSAADAQHIAAEFINRFLMERPPLPALALTTDTSIITSIGNDYSFNEIFSKQIKALGVGGDILLALSTSGNSPNVLAAVDTAKENGIYTVGLTGGEGGELVNHADTCMVVKGESTPRIQETHIFVGHMICELVDYILFQQGFKSE